MRNILILLVLLLGCTTGSFTDVQAGDQKIEPTANSFTPLSEREVKYLQDGTKYIVHPDKIKSGGPPKDGIPSIDKPKFVPMSEVDWIKDNELVLTVNYKGVKRVYPLQIMVWHEIINDVIAGDPIMITFCPLCGSAIGYVRVVKGEEVEFGTSGKLYNSNLVMYDRKTETYWSQIYGIGMIGEMAGVRLKQVSVDTVVWRDWKEYNPDSEVMTRQTGYTRNYGSDPYGSYYEDSYLMFPVENSDNKIHPKTVVFGVEIDGVFKAYRESDLFEEETIKDVVHNVEIKITRNEDGTVRVSRQDTGEEIIKERDFWFAWYAFHPETILYND